MEATPNHLTRARRLPPSHWVRAEEIAEEEFFYAVPDRPRLFIRCSSSPVRDEHGEIVAAVLSMTDITDRKRQEERLTYLADLLDNTEDGVVAMDERYFLTVWNRGPSGSRAGRRRRSSVGTPTRWL